jgi:hypothetical protein
MIEPASQLEPQAELQPADVTPDTVLRRAAAGVHLLFVPDPKQPHWLLWGSEAAQSALAVLGEPGSQLVPTSTCSRVRGYRLPLLEGGVQLAALTQGELLQLPPSVAVWSLAAKLGLELVAREQLLPRVIKQGDQQVARWSVVLNQSQDAERFDALIQAFPVAAHAWPVSRPEGAADAEAAVLVWTASALLREFLDTFADHLLRTAQPRAPTPAAASW